MEQKYIKALQDALFYLETDEMEIKSVLKQAASDNGINYGEEMQKFVDWAYKKIN